MAAIISSRLCALRDVTKDEAPAILAVAGAALAQPTPRLIVSPEFLCRNRLAAVVPFAFVRRLTEGLALVRNRPGAVDLPEVWVQALSAASVADQLSQHS